MKINIEKIIREVHSIKIWLILITTALLIKHFVSDTVWASFVSGLLAMREGSEFRHNYFGGDSTNGQSNAIGGTTDEPSNGGSAEGPVCE